MIVLLSARLVILSQPKTGSTALDHALRGQASITMNHPPILKHMSYDTFMSFIAPLIKTKAGLDRHDYEVVSVMREPIDWLGSWYRYRSREALKKGRKWKQKSYTGDVSFEDFVVEAFKPRRERQRFAKLGNPCGVALRADGSVGCDRIFRYEGMEEFYDFIQTRAKKPFEVGRVNVSPQGDISLSAETRALVETAWPFAFALYSSLKRDGRFDKKLRAGAGLPL